MGAAISVFEDLRQHLAEPVAHAYARAEELAKKRGGTVPTSAEMLLAILDRSPGVVQRVVPSADPERWKQELQEELAKSPPAEDGTLDRALAAAVEAAAAEGRDTAGLADVIRELASARGAETAAPAEPSRVKVPTPTLDKFGRDLTREAAEGKLQPISGRDAEIQKLVDTLCKTEKANALLVGPAGVGKTAIVEGLAQRIAAGDTPPFLVGARVVELQPSALVAGASMVGKLEERMQAILAEVRKARSSDDHVGLILFIDEFHTAMGAGGMMGLGDVASLLKPALARGEVACIGATTDREYARHIKDDPALERRFDLVPVKELDSATTLELLRDRRPRWEELRGIVVTDEALAEAVELAGDHMRNRYFPDKAIDVLEHAVARVYADDDPASLVGKDMIRTVVAERLGQPVGALRTTLASRIDGMAAFLKGRVLGQDHVIDAMVEVLRPKLLGLDEGRERPNGVLFFSGPTGVGKTELARSLAEFLHGSPDRLLRFDMSEFAEEHTISTFLGAPPSYVGFEMGSPLLEKVAQNPFAVVLLDEIEKAHPAVHKLFLQVFDAGVLTNRVGQHVYFSDTVIILTSNIDEFSRRAVGFGEDEIVEEDPRAVLRRHFPPELVNRIDYVGVFRDLPRETVRSILEERIVPALQARLREAGIELEVPPEAIDLIAELGFDGRSGARELRRVIDSDIMSEVSRFLGEPEGEGLRLRVTAKDGSLGIEQLKEE